MAGTGVPGFSGNKGPATKARLRGPAELAKVATPTGVVADADSVYLGDTFNHRVRRIHHGGLPPIVPELPVPMLLPILGLLTVGGGVVVSRRRRLGSSLASDTGAT